MSNVVVLYILINSLFKSVTTRMSYCAEDFVLKGLYRSISHLCQSLVVIFVLHLLGGIGCYCYFAGGGGKRLAVG